MEHPERTGGSSVVSNGHPEDSFIQEVVDILVRRWRPIVVVVLVATMLAVVVALLLPRDYAAEARVLRPEAGGLASMLGMAGQGAGGIGRLLLGGGGGDYTRYLAILNSRSLREAVVEEFDLVETYGLSRKRHPHLATLKRLDRNLEFKISLELQHLSVIAYDREPERAARISNFVVAELNCRNAQLTSEDARQTRAFLETRLAEARAALDSVRSEMQSFQERHGVVELEGQAQAFMTAVAQQSGRVTELEVQYQTLLAQYGADNPMVSAARSALQSARSQVRAAFGGSEALMPVAIREMPALSRQYAELMQEQMIQARVLEVAYPIYEQAQFQERSEMQAVQVIDPAFPPVLPARPSRRLIVFLAFMSALTLSVAYVLVAHWMRTRGPEIRWRRTPDSRVRQRTLID